LTLSAPSTNEDALNATFAALADPTRRAILARLATGEASVADLAAPFAMSQPAVSKHLRVLERAGLISRGRDAQRRPSRLEARPLAAATAWLQRYRDYWESNYQGLDAVLEELKAQTRAGAPKQEGKRDDTEAAARHATTRTPTTASTTTRGRAHRRRRRP